MKFASEPIQHELSKMLQWQEDRAWKSLLQDMQHTAIFYVDELLYQTALQIVLFAVKKSL